MSDSNQKSLDRVAHWQKLISEQEASGCSVRSFCFSCRIHPDTFYYNRRKLKKSVLEKPVSLTPSKFVSVQTKGDAFLRPLRIILPNGVAIELGGGLESFAVSAFVQKLCGVDNAKP